MCREDNIIKIEEIHKEIDLIQACITRMAQNSFKIKGWFVSIYTVILALLPEKVNVFLVCITLIAVNMWSRTLRWFYLIPLVIVVIVFAIKCGSTLCKIIQFCACK